ncbi:MAG: GPH family glycoside/pentoside/hexuronide:cation symporter [Bacteroidia bacterium]|jgi:GPH family glycoside/pentoside/hexuronide:cation symporter
MRPITASQKWSYAIGNMPFSVKDAAYVNFVVFYYTQVQGLSGSLAGLAMFIALSWDAISDPLVGSWSDKVHSRWGRRHPLILAGGLPTALLFIALFSVPSGLGQWGVFAWLTAVSLMLRTFLTINYIPFQAMGAELATDYDERTVIAKARVAMGWLAGMTMPAVGFLFIFTSDGETDGRLIQDNYETYGLLSAFLTAAATLICVWGTRSLIERLPKATSSDSWISLKGTISDFRMAFSNRNFRMTLGSNLSLGMAIGVYSTLSLYMGTYFWEFSTQQLAALAIPTLLATMLSFAVIGRLGSRWDKPTLLAMAALGVAFNSAWFIGARLIDVLPENGHPLIYALQLLNAFMSVFVLVCTHTLTASLIADILDEQELHTGQRQEGVFFAAGAFVLKATTGFGALIAGVVIDFADIAPGTEPGGVPADSLQMLGWFTMCIITALCLVSYAFTKMIRLSRADHMRLQAELAAQNATD